MYECSVERGNDNNLSYQHSTYIVTTIDGMFIGSVPSLVEGTHL